MSSQHLDAIAADPLARLDPANPHATYAELRASAPVHWSPAFNGWVLTRYDDVRAILDHPDFRVPDPSTRLTRLADRGGPRLANLIVSYACLSQLSDPERSRAPKRVFFQLLTGFHLAGFRQVLANRARDLLDAGAVNGEIDLAPGFGRRLAVFASWALFGIDEAAHEDLAASAGVSGLLSGAIHSQRELMRLDAQTAVFLEVFRKSIDQRRHSARDDGLSRMLRISDAELGWSDDQLAGFCAFILGASREATSAGLSGCCLTLLRDSVLRERLAGAPELRAPALREMLRLVSPFQFVSRTALRDTELAGQAVRAGQTVRAMIAAANRDPDVFPDPDTIVLDRAGPEPLTFSAGSFRCLGERLAQLEVAVAIDTLLGYPALRLADDPPVWGKAMHIRELRHAPAIFDPTETGLG